MSKEPFPSIESELTASPRPRVDLKTLAPRTPLPDDAVVENSRVMAEKWGASTQVARAEEPPPLAPLRSIRGYIPDYLDDELAQKAAARRVTKTFLILEALKNGGYIVKDADLIQDRRRFRQKGNM